MSSEKKKLLRRWILVFIYYIGATITIIIGAIFLIAFTRNPVGIILSISGGFIFLLGCGFIYMGNQEIDEPFSLWENEKVFASHTTLETISYPFHLEKPSVIKGHVSGTSGPYQFICSEFFGTNSERSRTDVDAVRPKTYLRGKGPEKTDIGPLSLPSGTYVLWFGDYRQIEASFTLNGTYRKKPYENIYNLGLTLLQIGIPIFITGSIFLGYGTMI